MYSTAQYFRFIEKSQIQKLILQSKREGFMIPQVNYKHRLKLGVYTWSFWSGQFGCEKTKIALFVWSFVVLTQKLKLKQKRKYSSWGLFVLYF